jgi:hypothetical protein
MKDDRNLPLESIKIRYSRDRYSAVSSMSVLSEAEIKSRVLLLDDALSCVSQEPLQFDIVSAVVTDVDETLNLSIKSVDYDGDSEESLDSENDELDDSFCVGRTRYSSYHSVDEFSDDETTMDSESLRFNASGVHLPEFSKESFTPILLHPNATNKRSVFFEPKNDGEDDDNEKPVLGFNGQYLKPLQYDRAHAACAEEYDADRHPALEKTESGPSSRNYADRGKRIVRKQSSSRYDPVGKRTRSCYSNR